MVEDHDSKDINRTSVGLLVFMDHYTTIIDFVEESPAVHAKTYGILDILGLIMGV